MKFASQFEDGVGSAGARASFSPPAASASHNHSKAAEAPPGLLPMRNHEAANYIEVLAKVLKRERRRYVHWNC
jgi:hypothetical protein